MTIEYRCSQCNNLLRTEDSAAGKQAQCPRCGAITVVPPLAMPADAAAPSSGPFAGSAPFAEGAGSAPPPDAANPYQSPQAPGYAMPSGRADPAAEQRVSAPATTLMVVAVLGAIGDLVIAAMYGVVLAMAMGGQANKLAQGNNPHELVLGAIMIEIVAIAGLIANIVVFLGARKMFKLESYAFAMVATVLTLIPGVSPCCILGLPFGIWAMIVLCDGSVKAAFRR